MILRRYQTLGSFPEWMVGIALLGIVSILSLVLWKVCVRPPVVIVPRASGVGEATPARPDKEYAAAFARHFLTHWFIWNQFTYGYRRTIAIGCMAPEVQGSFRAAAAKAADLAGMLKQSQSCQIESIEVAPADETGNIWVAEFRGNLTTYYAGVGGEPDPIKGALLLTRIVPTSQNPMCLEVRGFKTDKVDGSANLGQILRRADVPAQPAPTSEPKTPTETPKP